MQKTVKTYSEEGKKYQFDSKKMQMYANQLKYDFQKQGKKKNKGDIMKELAEKLYISEEAVKSWMYGNNGPSDLEQVKQVADYFSVEYHQLLDKEEEKMVADITTVKVNETQMQYTKERVRELYAALLYTINKTIDFFYIEEQPEGLDYEEYEGETNSAYNDAFTAGERVGELLEKYLLDIPEKLYNEIKEYLWTTLEPVLDAIDRTYRQRLGSKDMYNMDSRELCEFIDPFRRGGYITDLRRIFDDFIVK